jgi:hypothetical protein
MARKLARLVYRMLQLGHESVDKQQVQVLKKESREVRVSDRRTRCRLTLFEEGF